MSDLDPERGMQVLPLPNALMSMVDRLPNSLINVLDWFHENKSSVWIVGGANRNALLGTSIQEYDLATTMTPEEMKTYPDVIPTGERYGTITFRNNGDCFEVTTLRTEHGYNDGRRPDEVHWGDSLLEDLSRRDFTMNAIAINVNKQRLFDPFNGINDLKQRRIRSVGEATRRLSEDALRILRAYRFMDQGKAGIWWPERQLSEALRDTKPMLNKIASERIWSELKRILLGDHASEIVQRMADDGIFRQLLAIDWIQDDQRIQVLSRISGSNPIDRLAIMLRNFDQNQCEEVAKKLRLSRSERKELMFRHSKFGHLPQNMDSSMRIFAVVLGEWSHQHLQIEKMFARHESSKLGYTEADVEQRLQRLKRLNVDWRTEPIADGEFIMQRTGMNQGPKLGALKEWLYREQVARNLQTLEEIDTLLCTLAWQVEDSTHWPKLQFP